MSNLEFFVNPLIHDLKDLDSLGFIDYKVQKVKGFNVHQWVRSNNWRKDIVQLIYPKDDLNYCRIDFQVYLIVGEREFVLTGISLSKMANNSSDYRFPTIFKKARANQCVKSISKQLFESIEWFAKFKDKKSCLSIIQNANSEDNVAIAPNTNNYQIIEQMLNASK